MTKRVKIQQMTDLFVFSPRTTAPSSELLIYLPGQAVVVFGTGSASTKVNRIPFYRQVWRNAENFS